MNAFLVNTAVVDRMAAAALAVETLAPAAEVLAQAVAPVVDMAALAQAQAVALVVDMAALAEGAALVVDLATLVEGAAQVVADAVETLAVAQSRRMKKPACKQPLRRLQKRVCVHKA